MSPAGGGRAGVRARAGTSIALATVVLLLAWHGGGKTIRSASAPNDTQVSSEILIRGRDVYGANCATCHGLGGDGNGMAAHMFRVRPRDFRSGLFKFRSTPSGSLPTDDDLLRTVTEGIRWTGMVGRSDLLAADRGAVVQYVKTFSPRFASERPASPVAVPPAPTQSRDLMAEGRRIYREAECFTCHGERGRGDGPSAPGMKDDWGWPTRPSELTWRPLKRGSAPSKIYLTIATGLAGTPMPSYGDALDSQELWALVYYLESLVPGDHRLSTQASLGEEGRGWMVVRMGRMMGPGMMRRMPGMPMMR